MNLTVTSAAGSDVSSRPQSRGSGGRREKPKGGIKGFFRAPGLKAGGNSRPKGVVGNVQPVDVSHLVDEDYDQDEEEVLYNQVWDLMHSCMYAYLSKYALICGQISVPSQKVNARFLEDTLT